ncbi:MULTISPECIES: hypothetical protein [unclassified Aureispira]|uniref:hypothetical protein n=1 Tax=unclassified Aureispira TaxID=2649989 RepID=UPI0006977CE9|nr:MULTISPECIES: hypothetical protein [unclassified Aureispira]WMX16975.1 hypothetical protein QP953_11390 [Aureispira sp. CCB-E]
MPPQQRKQYILWINELRLKQAAAITLPHFYNPVAIIILVVVIEDTKNNEFIVIPKTSHSISKYITFIEKNNERVLKKVCINYVFNELNKNNFESLFFLVEIANSEDYTKALQEVEKILHTKSEVSEKSTSMKTIEKIQTSFNSFLCNNIFLWRKNSSSLDDTLELHIDNHLLFLKATLLIHLQPPK